MGPFSGGGHLGGRSPDHTEHTERNPEISQTEHTEQKMGFENTAVMAILSKNRVLRKTRSTPRSDPTLILSKNPGFEKNAVNHIGPTVKNPVKVNTIIFQ